MMRTDALAAIGIVVLLLHRAGHTYAHHCEASLEDTHKDQLGPFFIVDTQYKGCRFVPRQRTSIMERRITVSGYILDTECNHVPCAEIEVRV